MTNDDFFRRMIVAVVCITLILFSSFIAMMLLDRKAIALETVYPSIDCKYLYSAYKDKEILQQAGLEHYYYLKSQNSTFTSPPKIGILSCFCEKQKANSIENLIDY